jgi:hypothetical protein
VSGELWRCFTKKDAKFYYEDADRMQGFAKAFTEPALPRGFLNCVEGFQWP